MALSNKNHRKESSQGDGGDMTVFEDSVIALFKIL